MKDAITLNSAAVCSRMGAFQTALLPSAVWRPPLPCSETVVKQNSRALASPAVVDCCGRDTAMRCPRTAQRAVPTLLIIHAAHARTHAAARRHPAALFILRKFGDDGLGGEQEAGDRSGVLQRSA